MLIAVIYLLQNGKFVDIIIWAADRSWACCGWGRTSPFFFRTAASLHWSHCQSRRTSLSGLKALFFWGGGFKGMSAYGIVLVEQTEQIWTLSVWLFALFKNPVSRMNVGNVHFCKPQRCGNFFYVHFFRLNFLVGFRNKKYLVRVRKWLHFVLKYLFWSPQTSLEVVLGPP